ncbi:DUF7577 domain-containing protein [Haloarcula pelagica]|uniref:DUF7577 domain-containing protein n=1 Tax=Haloarcula pelagica TaxID=3033389 RepID=UPI0024C43D93|nr:hypothetical protein [Halomicroarcula sp. YJ-61-S]
MQLWGWLIAYVVTFGLVQLLLYHYFQHRNTSSESPESTPVGAGHGRPAVEPDGSSTPAEAVACPDCGTPNEGHTMIRYCRVCAATLQ